MPLPASTNPIDLVLEGGGVKGIGLVGAILAFDESGYEVRRVAGASAGAVVASIVAAPRAPRTYRSAGSTTSSRRSTTPSS
jgi:NTE family protein